MRSYKLLQSVAIKESGLPIFCSFCRLSVIVEFGSSRSPSSFKAENAGGSLRSVLSPNLHWHERSSSHPQYKRHQARRSTVPASAMASAESVLTATFWIFFDDHTIGFTALLWFLPMFWCAVIIIMPWWAERFFSEAKEASENATNRMSFRGMY